MAQQGRRPAKGSGRAAGKAGRGTPVRRNKAAPAERHPAPKPPKKTAAKGEAVVFDGPGDGEALPRTFRLGAITGATPGKWIDTWKQRMPLVPLELVPFDPVRQRDAIHELDAALVRLPVDDPAVHVIRLYDEVPVVVAAADSHLMAADELRAADLEGEVVITVSDDVLQPLDLPGTTAAAFGALTTAEAIATVASGVGIVVVPMSLARLHQRKDVDHRVLVDGPISSVALAWPGERTTADVEAFIGIVRGRTPNSSR